MDTFFLYIGKSAISSLLQPVSSQEISHSSADLTQCFNLVTRKVHFSSLSQSFCNPEHPPVSASQTKNYSSMKSGGSPVPWRWLCGSSGVPKAAVLTAHSSQPALLQVLGKAQRREKLASEDRRHWKRLAEKDGTATLPANHLFGTSNAIGQLFKSSSCLSL